MSRLVWLITIAGVSFTAMFARAEAGAAAPQPPQFIIGVWYQPISSFGKWKARGINTLIGCELEGGTTTTREQWCRAAREAGLFYVIRPTNDPAERKADAADPYLLAWEQQDEPDGGGNVSPEEIVARYKEFKAVGDKPVLLNLDGGKMQWRPPGDYQTYCQGADWIAFDYYVVNRGESPAAIPKIGERLDKLKAWTDGKKKLLAFIECSDQNLKIQEWTAGNDASGTPLRLKMRGPTADEVQAEVKVVLEHGGTGIVYFPQAIGLNFESFDAMPDGMAETITAINQKLCGLTPIAPLAPTPPRSPAVPAPLPDIRGSAPTAPATQPVDLSNRRVIIDGKAYRLTPAD